jgi:hypothetical protein
LLIRGKSPFRVSFFRFVQNLFFFLSFFFSVFVNCVSSKIKEQINHNSTDKRYPVRITSLSSVFSAVVSLQSISDFKHLFYSFLPSLFFHKQSEEYLQFIRLYCCCYLVVSESIVFNEKKERKKSRGEKQNKHKFQFHFPGRREKRAKGMNSLFWSNQIKSILFYSILHLYPALLVSSSLPRTIHLEVSFQISGKRRKEKRKEETTRDNDFCACVHPR